jgi:hypothetical protein
LGQKKTLVIRNWILNYVQGNIIDVFLNKMHVPRPVYTVVTVACNLDQISIVQIAIAKMGVYKWIAYCIYLAFFA